MLTGIPVFVNETIKRRLNRWSTLYMKKLCSTCIMVNNVNKRIDFV